MFIMLLNYVKTLQMKVSLIVTFKINLESYLYSELVRVILLFVTNKQLIKGYYCGGVVRSEWKHCFSFYDKFPIVRIAAVILRILTRSIFHARYEYGFSWRDLLKASRSWAERS